MQEYMGTERVSRVGIRNFVVGVTVKVASDENSLRKEKTYVNKLNLALVQVSSHRDESQNILTMLVDSETRMAT